jgi:hypothetical protein
MALSDVPLATQTLAVSQNPIRQNFIDINLQFGIDHGQFNSGANTGFHTKATFPVLAAPLAVAGTNIISCQSLNNGVDGAQPELVALKQLGAAAGVPLTARSNAFTEALYAQNGWTILPSGIKIAWGRTAPINGNTAAVITFPLLGGVSIFNQPATGGTCYSVTVTSNVGTADGSAAPQVDLVTANSFRIFNRSIGAIVGTFNGPFYWFAVGV